MQFDFLVVGAGISGAAAAYALSEHGRVLLVEAEETPGYHSTGRSAALYTPNFGSPLVRLLNAACYEFYANPPDGFADAPLLRARGALTWAAPGCEALLTDIIAQGTQRDPIDWIDRAEALRLSPIVRPEVASAAVYEAGVMDMDVAAAHQGFLKGLRRQGGEIRCSAPVLALRRNGGAWTAQVGDAVVEAAVVVNAAGAWGDRLARLAGAEPVGLVPKRRTAIVVDMPRGHDGSSMPLVEFAGEAPYFKPESGGLMASPGDETADEPRDVQPDDMDVAVLVDWLERRTDVAVKRAPRAWAGLRSFVSDGTPVVGFDSGAEGFFWLVGQGGYGIMLAPVLAEVAASLVVGKSLPRCLEAFDAHLLSADRFRRTGANRNCEGLA